MSRLEYVAGGSSKFWEITVRGRELETRWGRIGAEGQRKLAKLASPALAEAAAAKQVREKLAKGYVEVGGKPAKAAKAAKAAKPAKPTSSLAALIKLVAPPKQPVEAPRAAQWKQHEQALETALPADYKAMIEAYGTGQLDGFLWLANPFSTLMPWKPWFDGTMAALREGKKGRELLPWASTDNGNFFCFRTTGAPDTWSTVVFEGRGPRGDELPGGATAALVALLSRKHRSPVLAEWFPLKKHRFAPMIDEQKTVIDLALDRRPFAERFAFLRQVAGKAKVEQTYTGVAIVRVTGTTIHLTYRDCDKEDDGRVGAEIFACYATAEESEVRRIVREAAAAAKWKLQKIVDFNRKQARWGGKP